MNEIRADTPKFFFEPSSRNLADKLQVVSFSGIEGISQLMRFHIQLVGEDPDIDFEELLDNPASLSIATGDRGAQEHKYHGIVARVEQVGQGVDTFFYQAELVPRLWQLTLNYRCRIFQNLSVLDIIAEVFQDYFDPDDYNISVQRHYEAREYCVQYRETDFAFVSRLLEDEGIFYYFEYSDRKEILVLADDSSVHPETAPLSELLFSAPSGMQPREEQTISSLKYVENVLPTKFTLKDYNDQTPKTDLQATSQLNGRREYVHYDYPGGFQFLPHGNELARIRNEESEAMRRQLTGSSDCRSLYAGHRFKLEGHFRSALNQEYVLVGVSHSGTQKSDGGQIAEGAYSNHFECIPMSQTFRPARLTPKTKIPGVQTAEVVGRSGEKLYMDEHGRAKVKFHWDLDGQRNEESSCWVRVSHHFAGQNHGSQLHPLIGDEVIVEFLEGDPDRPIITGRVYNGNNRPPLKPEKRIQNILLTPYHHQLLLDDQAKSITFNTGGAEKVFMADGPDSEEWGNHIRISTADGHYLVLSKGSKLKGMELQTEAGHTIKMQDDPTPGILIQDKSNTLKLSFDSENEIIELNNEGSAQIDVKCENGTVNVNATEINITASSKVAIRADAEMTLSSPEIKITGDAKIHAQAPEMQLEGAAKLAAKGAQLALEGTAQLEAKGAMVKVQGSGITDIKGGLVKIN